MPLRVLMLGWEFPPFISGGLGRACFGLTRALDAAGSEVIFVLPRAINQRRFVASEHHRKLTSRTTLLAPADASDGSSRDDHRDSAAPGVDELEFSATASSSGDLTPDSSTFSLTEHGFAKARFIRVQSTFSSPYAPFTTGRAQPRQFEAAMISNWLEQTDPAAFLPAGDILPPVVPPLKVGGDFAPISLDVPGLRVGGNAENPYGSDLIGDAYRYARLAVAMTAHEQYDVIHAHDWLTFPAAQMLSQISGRPYVAHIHSTEFDRAGTHANARVVEVERAGLAGAHRIITVSQLTKSIIVRRHSIAPGKIDVVYNGIDLSSTSSQSAPIPLALRPARKTADQTVLFLGRITFQKGPEYFIRAAKRVLEVLPNVKFVLAGSGDLALRIMQEANALGIGQRVFFTGFLDARDVDRVFEMADCYVMPSVSEPFGIAALEALAHQVPVILSRTCGACEVLEHVLKVDFWDCDDIANKIIAVLRYPALAQTLRDNSGAQLHQLTWSVAAERCVESYNAAAKFQEFALSADAPN